MEIRLYYYKNEIEQESTRTFKSAKALENYLSKVKNPSTIVVERGDNKTVVSGYYNILEWIKNNK